MYDQIYTDVTQEGFYAVDGRHWGVFPVKYKKIEAEVHTSHKFDIVDYIKIEGADIVPHDMAERRIFENEFDAWNFLLSSVSKEIDKTKNALSDLKNQQIEIRKQITLAKISARRQKSLKSSNLTSLGR